MAATNRSSSPCPTDLCTSRLRMTLLRLSDSEAVADIIATYNTPAFAKFGFSAMGMRTSSDLAQKCQRHGPKPHLCTAVPEDSPVPSNIFHTVHIKETSEYIGFVVMNFRDGAQCPDFGYCFLEAFHGRGYAAEASREVLRFWTDDIGVKEVCLTTRENNIASQKLARRLGFVDSGAVVSYGADETAKGLKVFVLAGMAGPHNETVSKSQV